MNFILSIILNPIFVVAFLAFYHFYLSKPSYRIIHGKIKSVASDKFAENPISIATAVLKNVTFLKSDGSREVVRRLDVKPALARNIDQYRKSSLDGVFLIRKSFGRSLLFAYSDNASYKFAFLSDMIAPDYPLRRVIKATLFLTILGAFLWLKHDVKDYIEFCILFCFSSISFYFIWKNYLSSYRKKQFEIESKLLEEANIPVPLI